MVNASYLDIVIVVLITVFALYGVWKGFVAVLLHLVAMVAGIAAAYFFNDEVATWIARYIPWSEAARQNIAFFVILIIVRQLVSFALWAVNKVLDVVWRLPFIGSMNRLLGLVLGFIEGIAAVGVALAFIIAHPSGAWLMGQVGGSGLAPLLAPLGAALLPGISGVMKALKELREA